MKRSRIERKTPLRRSPFRSRKKKKRTRENERYTREIKRRRWANAPPHPDPSRPWEWHLDEIVPCAYGRKHKEYCTVERMSGPDNLQWLRANENIDKGIRLTPAARELIDRWKNEDARTV